MFKKIFIIICLIILSFGSIYARGTRGNTGTPTTGNGITNSTTPNGPSNTGRNNTTNNNNGPSTTGNGITNSTTPNGPSNTGRNNNGNSNQNGSSTTNTSLNSAGNSAGAAATAARNQFCASNPLECIEKPSFMVSTVNIFGDNRLNKAGTTKELVNNTLGTIIQKLMIAMGSIALLIMTIGGGYMIFHAGKDDILSKGKSIFTGGLIALVVALSSYYIISIVRFILYKGN